MKRSSMLMAVSAGLLLVAPTSATFAQQGAPGPDVTYMSNFEVPNPPAHLFDVVQEVVVFEPGHWTPTHTHGGQAFITILEGQLNTHPVSGQPDGVTDAVFGPGQSFVENPGEYWQNGNTGSETTRALVTFLLPKGAPLTTVGPSAN
jgi:quercetin dioxygenase-like cupin family protein